MNTEYRDIHNKLFWEKLSEVFQQTMKMIKEMAEEQGIDLDNINTEAIEEAERQLDESARYHECTKSAEVYHQKVDDWLDSAGSVKVALIGMDRSIAAWGILLKYFTSLEDEILSILVHLEQLCKNTEKAFPDARAFVRPGFDEKLD